MDGSIHVGFGGEVHDGPRLVVTQQEIDQGAIADIAFDEAMARVVTESGKVRQIARVGQGIKGDDRLSLRRMLAGEPIQDEVRANEAGAAGDEDHVRETLTP
jgi:hypothetical protein